MGQIIIVDDVKTVFDVEFGWKTILMNCNCHTFDEVIEQIIKAIGCSHTRASQLASAVHHLGQATICEGERRYCEHVGDVLSVIGLRVEVTN